MTEDRAISPVDDDAATASASSGRTDDGSDLPVWRRIPTLIWRTIVGAWDHGIIGWAAQAAFWQALSFAPLLLGLLGSIGYFLGWLNPDITTIIHDRILDLATRTFTADVVGDLIAPTLDSMLNRGRAGVVSVGFVISLWAGSSAVSAFVDSIVEAHGQTPLRHPVRQRFYALGLYVIMLVFAIAVAPLVALGPRAVAEHIPDSWDNVLRYGYYPALFLAVFVGVTILYRVSLPAPIPTHRLVLGAVLATVVFLVATFGLRIYLTWITSTGYTYGALATPIAFLLFAFFLGFAVMFGAELNAAIQEEWPAADTHTRRLREWLEYKALNAGFSGGAPAPAESRVPEHVEPPVPPPPTS